jgi:hypothetical protein
LAVDSSSDDDDWGNWRGDHTVKVDHEDEMDANADLHAKADVAVATYRDWAADDELQSGILEGLQALYDRAEAKKGEIAANTKKTNEGQSKPTHERPRWWKKRGTSTRGGAYGLYGLYIQALALGPSWAMYRPPTRYAFKAFRCSKHLTSNKWGGTCHYKVIHLRPCSSRCTSEPTKSTIRIGELGDAAR